MSTNPWFKFYGGEYLADPKIASLSAQERSCWITLLSLAGMSSTPGIIEYLTIEVLLDKSGVPFDPYNPENWNAALGVLKRFENMKMISTTEDGIIEIRNWKKRQETALTNAERQARYRESNGKVTGRITKVTLEENRVDKNTSEQSSQVYEIVPEKSRSERTKSKPKYPNAPAVFSWFPHPEPSWQIDTTQCKHAELLFDRGEPKVKSILSFVEKHKDEEYFPKVTKPSDLERKWEDIKAYRV